MNLILNAEHIAKKTNDALNADNKRKLLLKLRSNAIKSEEFLPIRDSLDEVYADEPERLEIERKKRELDKKLMLKLTEPCGFSKKAVGTLLDKIFGASVKVESSNNYLKNLEKNIDECSTTLFDFLKNVTADAIWTGVSGVVVDYNNITKNHFCQFVSAQNILGVEHGSDGNLDLLRFKTYISARDPKNPYNKIQKEAVRLYQRTAQGVATALFVRDSEGNYALSDEPRILLGIKRIPFILFYPERDQRTLDADLPLIELAEIEKSYIKSSVEQKFSISYARIPLLFFSGVNATSISLSSSNVFCTDEIGASASYVETSGAALEQGWRELEKLEQKAEFLTNDLFLTKSNGSLTATENVLNQSKIDNRASAIAVHTKRLAQKIFELICEWSNIKNDVEIVMNTRIRSISQSELQLLQSVAQSGFLSGETLRKTLSEFKLLPTDFDLDEERELVASEKDSIDRLTQSFYQ